MGTKLGPSYANLFLGYIAHQFFNQYDGPKPELYRCYIDDCVGNTSSTREKLDQFLSRYQSFRRRQRSVGTLRNDDVAWVDVVRDKIYTLCACVHNLSNYCQTSPTHAAAKLVGLKSS